MCGRSRRYLLAKGAMLGDQMKPKLIVIHFGEIWLKGGNRRQFIQRLYNNLVATLKDEDYETLENDRDRLLLHLTKKSNYESINKKLEEVFGISWFGGCITVKSGFRDIVDTILKVSKDRCVRLEVHRSDKSLPFKSYEVVSEMIKLSKKKKISLDVDSEDVVYVKAAHKQTYVSFDKRQGAQGLPVGCSGKAVILLSGGIDSPVASYYAMKRGLEPIYLHIHGFPTADKKKLRKVYDVLDTLSGYSAHPTAYFAPFHLFQAASLEVPRKVRAGTLQEVPLPSCPGDLQDRKGRLHNHGRKPGAGSIADDAESQGDILRNEPDNTEAVDRDGQAGDC